MPSMYRWTEESWRVLRRCTIECHLRTWCSLARPRSPWPMRATAPPVAHMAGERRRTTTSLFSTSGTGATTDNLTLTIAALGVLPDMPGNIKVEVFRNAFDAQAGTNAIGSLTRMLSGAVTVVDGVQCEGHSGHGCRRRVDRVQAVDRGCRYDPDR